MPIVCKSINELDQIAKTLIDNYKEYNVFAFFGQLGAGKTTFIKSICKYLQVTDIVSSPSFSIINEYKTALNESVYHMDFYRIKRLEEVYDLGYEDYFYSNSYCFIEWPEKIEKLLPEKFVYIQIEVDDLNKNRIFKIINH